MPCITLQVARVAAAIALEVGITAPAANASGGPAPTPSALTFDAAASGAVMQVLSRALALTGCSDGLLTSLVPQVCA